MTTTMTSRLGLVVVLGGALLLPRAAAAQTVQDVLLFLLTNQSVPTGSPAHDEAAARATGETIARALLASATTLPQPTSSSAFVYELNPELGTVERTTEGFGPFFVERALPAGRGRASVGVTFQQLRFDALDGRSLRDGSFVTTANRFPDEEEPFDVERLKLALDASIATLYGSFGLTDRLEIGLAAPLVTVRMEGSRTNTYRGEAFKQAAGRARATGLGDVVTRLKYAIPGHEAARIAAAADLRLPTGREQDLLGAGKTSIKLSSIVSVGRGFASGHVNVGVALGGLAREVHYQGAIEMAATPRFTVLGELLGRWIDAAGRVVPVSAPNQSFAGVETVRLVPDESALTSLTAAAGFKWNVSETWVLAANLVIPLTSSGLTVSVAPSVGVDYAWEW